MKGDTTTIIIAVKRKDARFDRTGVACQSKANKKLKGEESG